MSDVEILASLLLRFTEGRGYWCFGDNFLTIDSRVTITPDEAAALERAIGQNGQGWWTASMTERP